MYTLTKSSERAINLLAQTRRTARVVGWGTPPEVHYQNGWKLEILKSYSTLPLEVKTRLNILRAGGIDYTHVLIAHETKQDIKRLEIPKEVVDTITRALPVLASIVRALAVVLGAVALVIARVLVAAIMVDPVVIVVIQPDDPRDQPVWLEIAQWYD